MRKTFILAAALAALALPAAAQSDQVGAPSSAAGGAHTEPLSPPPSSLPSAAGPLGTSPDIRPSQPTPDFPARTIEPGIGKYKTQPGVPCSTFIGRDHDHC
jgi:hypothetical protein